MSNLTQIQGSAANTIEICPTTLKAGQQFMPMFNNNVYTVKSDFDEHTKGCFIAGPDYEGHCTFFDCPHVRLIETVPTIVLPSPEQQAVILEQVRSNKLQRFDRHQVFTEKMMDDMHTIINEISEITIGFSMVQNEVQGLWDGFLYPNLVQSAKEVGCSPKTVALLQDICQAAQNHINRFGESEPCIY